MFCLRNNENVL